MLVLPWAEVARFVAYRADKTDGGQNQVYRVTFRFKPCTKLSRPTRWV